MSSDMKFVDMYQEALVHEKLIRLNLFQPDDIYDDLGDIVDLRETKSDEVIVEVEDNPVSWTKSTPKEKIEEEKKEPKRDISRKKKVVKFAIKAVGYFVTKSIGYNTDKIPEKTDKKEPGRCVGKVSPPKNELKDWQKHLEYENSKKSKIKKAKKRFSKISKVFKGIKKARCSFPKIMFRKRKTEIDTENCRVYFSM